jgi:hypothetical protein
LVSAGRRKKKPWLQDAAEKKRTTDVAVLLVSDLGWSSMLINVDNFAGIIVGSKSDQNM